MRLFTVPARYRDELAAAINSAVEIIRMDIYRREHGHTPTVPDSMIRPELTGDVVVVFDVPAAAVDHLKDAARPKPRRIRRTA